MKNTMKLFWLLAAASVVLSCSKEAGQNLEATPGEEKTPAVITPATDGNLLTSFGVTFEGDVQDEETKVSVNLGTGATAMVKNDEVLVFVDGENNAIYKYDGAKFVLKEGETAVALDAPASVYYPASEFAKTTADFTMMPAAIEASGNFGAINPMAGVITGEPGSYSVTLGNIASVLRVIVSADVNITSVSLDYGDGVSYAAGSTFSVNASTKAMTAKTDSAETTETVELETPGIKADVLFILPTLELSNGLTVTANLEEEHNGGEKSFSISKARYTPVASKISSMSFYAGLFSGGAGTSAAPYKIANARDFKNIQKYTVSGYRDADGFRAGDFLAAHYLQIADIDFKNASLTPIGNSTSAAFTGTYDGDDNKLSNISIGGGSNAGLFGYTSGATISNLIAEKISVSGTGANRGAFIGYMTGGTIDNCHVTGESTVSGNQAAIGGIVGSIRTTAGTITGCSSTADVTNTVTSPNDYATGGILGMTWIAGCEISNCNLYGSVNGGNANYVGGIVGRMHNGSDNVSSCTTATGKTISGLNCVGGIVGVVEVASTISGCENASSVSGTENIGGIAGKFTAGEISSCYSHGNVTATGICAGGLVGLQGSGSGTRSTIDQCRMTDAIVKGTQYVGGIAGEVKCGSALRACYTQGTVKGTHALGGVVGYIISDQTANDARIIVSESLAKTNVTILNDASGEACAGGFAGHIESSAANYVFIYQNGVLADASVIDEGMDCTHIGSFAGKIKGSNTNMRIYDAYSLIGDSNYSVSTSYASVGGFVGNADTADIRRTYYCNSDNEQATSNLTSTSSLVQISASDINNQTLNKPGNAGLGGSTSIEFSTWDKTTTTYPVPSRLVEYGYYGQ